MPTQTLVLLRPDEVREQLGVSERTLRYMVRRGDIACVRVGRLLRFTEQNVADYIKRKTVKASA